MITLYGKVYHFWQVDRGDKLPLGPPELMTSFSKEADAPEFKQMVGERDSKYGVSYEQKKEKRAYIKIPEVHEGTLT